MRTNVIRDISPLSEVSTLRFVDLSENAISDISPLSNLTKVVEIGLSNNRIEDISVLAVMPDLKLLKASANRIGDISPLAKLNKLESLSIHLNSFENIDALLSSPNIRELNLQGLKSLVDGAVLGKLLKLEILDIQWTLINDYSFIENLKSLKEFRVIFYRGADTRPLAALTNLENLKVGYEIEGTDELDYNFLRNLRKLKVLDVRDFSLSSIDFLDFLPELENLKLSSLGEVRDASPLSRRTKLRKLSIQSTIADANALNNLAQMEDLNLALSSIDSLDFVRRMPKLISLTLGDLPVEDLRPLAAAAQLKFLFMNTINSDDYSPIGSLTGLESLQIANSSLSDLRFLRDLRNIVDLDISENDLNLDLSLLSAQTKLKVLDISFLTSVSGFDQLANFNELEFFALQSDGINDCSLIPPLRNLKKLFLRDNEIEDISCLQGMPALTELDLRGNEGLQDLSALSNLSLLQFLDAGQTSVRNIDVLQNSMFLTNLTLDFTQVDSLAALTGLQRLLGLFLDGTPAEAVLNKTQPVCAESSSSDVLKEFCEAKP